MLDTRQHLISICFLLCCVFWLNAQITEPRFRQVTIDDGLSPSAVCALLQM